LDTKHLSIQPLRSWYLSNLARLCIASPLHLVAAPLGKANAEHPQSVIISGLHIYMSFDQSLPFSDQRPQLVSCEIHSLKRHIPNLIEIICQKGCKK